MYFLEGDIEFRKFCYLLLIRSPRASGESQSPARPVVAEKPQPAPSPARAERSEAAKGRVATPPNTPVEGSGRKVDASALDAAMEKERQKRTEAAR